MQNSFGSCLASMYFVHQFSKQNLPLKVLWEFFSSDSALLFVHCLTSDSSLTSEKWSYKCPETFSVWRLVFTFISKGLILSIDLEDFPKTNSWKLNNLPSVQNSNQKNPEQDYWKSKKKERRVYCECIYLSLWVWRLIVCRASSTRDVLLWAYRTRPVRALAKFIPQTSCVTTMLTPLDENEN